MYTGLCKGFYIPPGTGIPEGFEIYWITSTLEVLEMTVFPKGVLFCDLLDTCHVANFYSYWC